MERLQLPIGVLGAGDMEVNKQSHLSREYISGGGDGGVKQK